ncbi:hypothetical protein N8753_01695 [Pelagibacteraceae bacterium]|nr:hypothetical protein [Pelagibacteraceae bacterium]
MKKRNTYTFIILFVLFQAAIAYSDQFTLSAKIGPIKKIVYKFSYEMNIDNNDYNLKFNLYSQDNFIEFLTDETIGNGFSRGEIKEDIFITKNYEYLEKKEGSIKKYFIDFNDPNNIKGIRIPSYDKSKLTPIEGTMLVDIFDPALIFYKLANFLDLENCNKKFKIYDAKRRFDLSITKVSEDQNGLKCLMTSNKIGGYKIKDKINPLEIPYEMIIEFKYIGDNLRMTSIEGKNSVLKIIVERI